MRRPMGIGKTSNAYADEISPDLFSACPKKVFAAIAVSCPINNGGNFEYEWSCDEWVATEWDRLHLNGIVPQPLPARFRHLVVDFDTACGIGK